MSKMIEEKNSTSEIFTNLIQYSEKNNTQLTPFLTQKQIKNKITYRIQSQRPESTLEKITGGNELTMEGYTFLQIYQEIPHRIISWSSYESLNIMRSSAHLFVDGTFLTAPKGFSQLIILSVWDTQTNCFVVTNYTLIDSKLEDNYESLFYLLFKKIPNFSPQFITCDFEHALTNSLKKRFPKSKLIHCFFHFTQCLRRKMDSLGNKKNHEFDFLFNKLKEFISLGPKQLIKAWEHIYSQYNTEKFRIFLNYFYKIFFIQHPPVTWNISSFNRDIEKTNAFLEGNNSLLNSHFNHRKPTLEKFIFSIRKLEFDKMVILRDLKKRKTKNPKFNYNQNFEFEIVKDKSKWEKFQNKILKFEIITVKNKTEISNTKKGYNYQLLQKPKKSKMLNKNKTQKQPKKKKKKKQSKKKKNQIKCSVCGKLGHNKRTCSKK